MIDYDSFSHCHLRNIFFAIFAGAKELKFSKAVQLLVFETAVFLRKLLQHFTAVIFFEIFCK